MAKRIKLLVIGDTHFMEEGPSSRCDNYLESTLNDLEEALQIGISKGCNAVLHLGDVFHIVKPGGVCRNRVIRMFAKYRADFDEMLALIGNHDIKHDMTNFPPSAIKSLFASNLFTHEEIYSEEYGIGLAHFHADIEEDIRDGKFLDHPAVIWAAHANITTGPFFGSYVTLAEIPTPPETKLILAGHIHYPIEGVRADGVKFINPGALCRNSMTQDSVERLPQVLIVEYERDGSFVETEYVTLVNAKLGHEIFNVEAVEHEKQRKAVAAKYIQDLNTFKSSWGEGAGILDSVRQSAQVKSVPDPVVEMALNAVEAAMDKRKNS